MCLNPIHQGIKGGETSGSLRRLLNAARRRMSAAVMLTRSTCQCVEGEWEPSQNRGEAQSGGQPAGGRSPVVHRHLPSLSSGDGETFLDADTAGNMAFAARFEGRHALAAGRQCAGAARSKAAARRQCRKVGRRTRDRHQPSAGLGAVQIGRKEPLGLGVGTLAHHGAHAARFHKAAGIHHGNRR